MAAKTLRRLNLDPRGGPLYVEVAVDTGRNTSGDHQRKGSGTVYKGTRSNGNGHGVKAADHSDSHKLDT